MYDDVGCCWRIRLAGYKVVCITGAKVYHYGTATLGKENPILWYYLIRNNMWTLAKNSNLKNFLLKTMLMTGEASIGLLGHILFKLRDYRKAVNMLRGYIDGLRGLRKAWSKKGNVKRINMIRDEELNNIMNIYIDIDLLLPLLKKLMHRL